MKRLNIATETIFLIVLAGLAIGSLFVTAFSDAKTEAVTWRADQPILLALSVLAVFAVFALLKMRERLEKIRTRNLALVLSLLFIVFGLLFCAIARVNPASDQALSLLSAREFLAGNYRTSYYLGYWPHQLGLYFYLMGLNLLTGDHDFLVFQYINVFVVAISNLCIIKTVCLLFRKRAVANLTAILLILFLPMFFFTTFVYNNLIGLVFATGAVLCQVQSLQTGKLRHGIAAAALIAVSVLLRQNYWIILIAMLLFYVFSCLSQEFRLQVKRLHILFLALLALVFALAVPAAAKAVFEKNFFEIGEGVPTSAFIAMGLQEGGGAPGWWNGYNLNIYTEHHGDAEAANSSALLEIENRLADFKESPEYAADFFSRKISSMWLDPSFQGLQIIESRWNRLEEQRIGKRLLHGDLRQLLDAYMNVYQSLILFSAICFLVLRRRSISTSQLFFAVVFLGTFIFHIFWEAKGQYAVTFFIFLIPYAAAGLTSAAEKTSRLPEAQSPDLCYDEGREGKKTWRTNSWIIMSTLKSRTEPTGSAT